MFDTEGSVTGEGRLAELVRDYRLVEESILSADARTLAVGPGARLIYGRDRWERLGEVPRKALGETLGHVLAGRL